MKHILKFVLVVLFVNTILANSNKERIDSLLNYSYGTFGTLEVYGNDVAINELGVEYVILYTNSYGEPGLFPDSTQEVQDSILKNQLAVLFANIRVCQKEGLDVIVGLESVKQAESVCAFLRSDSLIKDLHPNQNYTSPTNIIGWLVGDEVDNRGWSIEKQDSLINTIQAFDSGIDSIYIFGGSNLRDHLFSHRLSDKYDYIFLSNYITPALHIDTLPDNHLGNIGFVGWTYGSPHLAVGGLEAYGLDKCIPVYESYLKTNENPFYTLDHDTLIKMFSIKSKVYNKPGPFFASIVGAADAAGDSLLIDATILDNEILKTAVTEFIKKDINYDTLPYLQTKSINAYYPDIVSIQSYGSGTGADEYLVGDWNGDGYDNIAMRIGNTIYFDTTFDGDHDFILSFENGNDADQYLVGDWDGNGDDNIAIRIGNVIIMDYDFDGLEDARQGYGIGNQADEYLVGDWDGNGDDNIAMRIGNKIYMDYDFDDTHDTIQSYGNGNAADQYLVGDWDGDTCDNIAIRVGNKIHADINYDGHVDHIFEFGVSNPQIPSNIMYFTGDWSNDGFDNVAFLDIDKHTLYKSTISNTIYSNSIWETAKQEKKHPTYDDWLSLNDSITIDLGTTLEYVFLTLKFSKDVDFRDFEFAYIDSTNTAHRLDAEYNINNPDSSYDYGDINPDNWIIHMKSLNIRNISGNRIVIKNPEHPKVLYNLKNIGFAGFTSDSVLVSY